MTKSMIYTPSQVAPPGKEDWWEQTKRHDDLIIAGRPYSIDEECLETGFDGVGTVSPVGGSLCRKCEKKQDSDGTGTTGTINSEHKWGSRRHKRRTFYCITASHRKRHTS